MRTLGVTMVLLVSFGRTANAAPLAPTKPSQVVTLQSLPGLSGTCPKGDVAVDRQIAGDGTLMPFTGAPPGQVLVITGLDWATGSGSLSGQAITVTLQLDPGNGGLTQAVFADQTTTSVSVEHEAGRSLVVSNVVVKPGICLGVRVSNTPPGLGFAIVHGYLTKDK
jgi:hypothetical protein